MLGIIDDGDVNQAVRAAKLKDKRAAVWRRGGIFLVELIGILNVAKKSKKVKRGAPARKKKGMKMKAKRAKRAKSKKRAPKPAPAPTTAPPQPAPVPPTLAGMTEDQ
jgi:hypothetical protein